jgi:hypothetical protein
MLPSLGDDIAGKELVTERAAVCKAPTLGLQLGDCLGITMRSETNLHIVANELTKRRRPPAR